MYLTSTLQQHMCHSSDIPLACRCGLISSRAFLLVGVRVSSLMTAATTAPSLEQQPREEASSVVGVVKRSSSKGEQQVVVTGADALLDWLERAGVEYLFCSPIAALAPLWEAFAKRAASSTADGGSGSGLQRRPVYVNCRHESLAVGLAMGYFKQTGRPQAVCLPTGLGVWNGSMALRSAHQEHIPMLVLSPDTLTYGEVPGLDPGAEWPTFLVDKTGPARAGEAVTKWSHEVKTPQDMASSLGRALFFANQVPRGPALLSLPFDFLLSPPSSLPFPLPPSSTPTTSPGPALAAVASLLAHAKCPVLITEHAGVGERARACLRRLVDSLAMPLFEWWMPATLNLTRAHPLHGRGAVEEVLPMCDVVLVVGSHGPWHGPKDPKLDHATVVVVEEDPLRPRSPYWGYKTDMTLPGDIGETLSGLEAALSQALAGLPPDQRQRHDDTVHDRRDTWTARFSSQRESFLQQAQSEAEGLRESRVHALSLFEALRGVLPKGAVVVDEIVAQVPYLTGVLFEDEAQQLEHHRGWQGGLGTGLAVAMGAKLARPDKVVVCVVGDGAFNYNPVPAALGLSSSLADAAVLVIVCNNDGYVSQTWNLFKYFPQGSAVANHDYYGKVISPAPRYSRVGEAWGVWGEEVTGKGQLQGALERALKVVVEERRTAILDVHVTP